MRHDKIYVLTEEYVGLKLFDVLKPAGEYERVKEMRNVVVMTWEEYEGLKRQMDELLEGLKDLKDMKMEVRI